MDDYLTIFDLKYNLGNWPDGTPDFVHYYVAAKSEEEAIQKRERYCAENGYVLGDFVSAEVEISSVLI